AHGRTAVREDMAASVFNDFGVAVLVGPGLDGALGEEPQLAVLVHFTALDQRGGSADLLDGVVRATQHHIVHLGAIAVGVQALVDRTPLRSAITHALDRAVAAIGLLHRHGLGRDPDQVIHLHTAG